MPPPRAKPNFRAENGFSKSDYNLNKTDPEAIACYNMLDPKSSMLKNVLFSGSYQSYNERVIGLSKHCLS